MTEPLSLHGLRQWHAVEAASNEQSAAKYRQVAATAHLARWKGLIDKADAFKALADHHAAAVVALNALFPSTDVAVTENVAVKVTKPRVAKAAPTLSIYKFSFKGLALGGEAVVVADSAETASSELASFGGTPCGDEPVLDSTSPLTVPSVVHYDSGDY